MSKITPANIKDKQFLPEHFNSVTDFDAWLQGIIDTQEALLTVRIGSALYGSTDTNITSQVKDAATAMVCADLTERRILRASGSVNQETSSVIKALMDVRKSYLDTASSTIATLVNSGGQPESTGYAGGVVVTGSTTSLMTRFP